ncbi:hypothetical protein UFOVP1290_162 [uncultured Caudovirales phage]|uniref:Uncharacterized protein n=1 Tax=uncultured Caudovirales phage TaxID=2100421 RepID=A0A6J5RKQ7_9CAUD|nr:hypothetical protein UFOVP1290_162 [uncultured Caudovirales phage]
MKLRGRTNKGKNRIRELGEDWILVKESETVSFSSERGWLMIQPISNPDKGRWILSKNDPDFEVVGDEA